MVRGGVCTLWALFSLVPAILFVRYGAGEQTVVSTALVALGWVLIPRAVARDPDGANLLSFARSRSGIAFGVAMAAFLLLVAAVFPVRYVPIAILVCSAVTLVLWSFSRTETDLSRSAGNALLTVGSLCLVAGLCEISFRLPFVVARTGGNTPGMLRWEEKNYDRQWEKNSFRLRSFHTEKRKTPEALRVVVLGDSFTWGDKIARTEDTWPYVMEAALSRSGRRAEVISLATRGYTTVNEAEALRTLGPTFEPDCLVVQFYLNDTLPSGPNFAREGDRWHFRTWPLSPMADELLNARSYVYSFLSTGFRSIQMRVRYPDGFTPLFADDYAGWMACRSALEEMARRATELRIPLLVVVFPSFTPGSLDADAYPYAAIHRKVMAALVELGVPALDLTPVYAEAGRDGSEWWALPCDRHPNVEAHAIAGEAIARKLEDVLGDEGAGRDSPPVARLD